MSTVNIGNCYNSDTKFCKIFLDENKKINVLTLGIGSYGESSVESDDDENSIHILVGRYSAIGEQTIFSSTKTIGDNQVANYPFGKILKKADIAHRQIIIGNDVRIGRGCTIFSGVKIGNGAIINDNSVVREDVPPYAVVGGNSAKIIKRRFTADIIDKLQKIKWWYWDKKIIEERLPLMNDVESFCNQFDVANNSDLQAEELEKIKRSGLKTYFILADVDTSDSIWKKVVNQYASKYPIIKNTCLLIGCANEEEKKTITKNVDKILGKRISSKINVLPIIFDTMLQANVLFSSVVDVLITTREDLSSICVDYAADYNKTILSGLDNNIFDTPKFISVRENTPLLTIGFPTYNRSKYIQRNLQILCPEVGNDPRVEIYISDNDSTDDTQDAIKPYLERYNNIRYNKNSENIGGDRNILKIYQKAHGNFVVAHDDDDTTFPVVWSKVLTTLSRDENCGVIGLRNTDMEYSVIHGTTISEYINLMSYWTTDITTVILNKSSFDKIDDQDKCIRLNFNQVYLQLEILKQIPHFYVIAGKIFQMGFEHPVPGGYNYADVFIKNYFDILINYAGLSKEEISREKLRILQGHIFNSFIQLKAGETNYSFDKGEKIFAEYYKDEPYYKQAVKELMKIDAATAEKRWSKYL